MDNTKFEKEREKPIDMLLPIFGFPPKKNWKWENTKNISKNIRKKSKK
jgi:hypothetical protein